MKEKIKLILHNILIFILIIPLYFLSFLFKYILTIIDTFFELLLYTKRYKSILKFKEKKKNSVYFRLIRTCIEFINTKEL